jgi:mono/diheme cytochrome c family protein
LSTRRRHRLGLALGVCLAAAACRQDMHDQPRYDPLEHSSFFPDGRTSRPWAEGVVPEDAPGAGALETGRDNGEPVQRLPVALTLDLVRRGRTQYDVFCAPCHDRTGAGNGMIVQRGFRRPPSLQEAWLIESPDGHFFDVVTNGFGVMPSYGPQIAVEDRWAIVAYVRALQLSQRATLADVPAASRGALEGQP